MTGQNFVVRANRLNFRRAPGLEADIMTRLVRGTSVELIDGAGDESWWRVRPSASLAEGYVARRFLAPVSATTALDTDSVNDLLWHSSAQAIAGGVRYKLGEKDSATGRIDCSGWVAEITLKAFSAVNAAAVPEIVYDKYDNRVLRNHSDGIVTGLAAHTGFAMRGNQLTETALRNGMLIGINFGMYNWERNEPPRKYGIDHIVQVVTDPATSTKHITQSSSSGNGVNLVRLDEWLNARVADRTIAEERIYAVDPFLLADPNTGYSRRTPITSVTVPAAVRTSTARHPAFAGRGMYIYTVAGLLRTYGTIENCVREMQRCRLQHIWVRVHGRGYIGDEKGTSPHRLNALIAAARQGGIAVAGWGWCQGENPLAEAKLAADALATFGVDDYIADIEWGVSDADWTGDEVYRFIQAVRGYMKPGAGLGLSSHGFIEYQKPQIFKKAAPLIDYMNPQAYWFEDKPNRKMLQFIKASEATYPLRSPAAYARLCFDRWSALYKRPIVLTGHTAPEADMTAADSDRQLAAFLSHFQSPTGLVGVNYWHWGATSRASRDLLAAATSP